METKDENSCVPIASSHASDLICSGKAVFIWCLPIAALPRLRDRIRMGHESSVRR